MYHKAEIERRTKQKIAEDDRRAVDYIFSLGIKSDQEAAFIRNLANEVNYQVAQVSLSRSPPQPQSKTLVHKIAIKTEPFDHPK